ncbi:MAG: hypothetical protein LKF00_10005 [Olsenella sp.]|jgi:TPR repeat protein|nr:hypothetical protein [Olsenella sp.]MCI1289944.1 hypothetical protein [Olsenella sp.]
MAAEDYELTGDDVARIAELGGLPVEDEPFSPSDEDEKDAETWAGDALGPDAADADGLLKQMAEAALDPDPDEFSRFMSENKGTVARAADDPRVPEMVELGYRFGISRGSVVCMNDLGACYYMGDILEQDYQRARELYQMAADHGCQQSIINLGYIFEYGRTGEPDYARAYQCYALAAALEPSWEASYKLGDMYSRGRSVERNLSRAHLLWERSLELAKGIVQIAQPAIRIAQLLVNPDCAKWGIEPDPLRTLMLFQQAEVGLRVDIANGQTYYRRRLQQAIDGQRQARELVEENGLE